MWGGERLVRRADAVERRMTPINSFDAEIFVDATNHETIGRDHPTVSNREDTLRAYGKASDAYAVFRKMLKKGNPPDDWETLVAAAKKESVRDRLGHMR
ncbi:type II toxin-antitoxin system YhaV family toxin [Methylocystis parvus]|uniref:Type II toxin-antitoxin system YhaV family toxin n=1 Tax=Methylocystis parvus TaxID=134 RepID=A0A6B8M729_9HYPH|nr:type II toxin-antitoxin system YhaV family toxin [Methylocystis parvus]